MAASAILLFALTSALLAISGPARGDQVPANSAAYYHVGDNQVLSANAVGDSDGPAFACATGCAWDGNYSSAMSVTGSNIHPGDPSNCGNQAGQGNANFSYEVRYPLGAQPTDLVHVKFQESGTSTLSVCVFLLTASSTCDACTSDKTRIANQNNVASGVVTDLWINATPTTAYGLYFRVGQNTGACSCTVNMTTYEVEAFNKNATTSDPVRALANQAAAAVQCNTVGAAQGTWSSDQYNAPLGTFYLMIPSIMPASPWSTPNPMQVFTTATGVNASFYGWSNVLPDVSGARSDAVAIWNVTTNQSNLPIFVKPTGSGSVNATDTTCAFARVGSMASSTLNAGYVTAPLSNWGGGAHDLWGVAYMANGYPVNSVYDTDLSGFSSVFLQDNMTFGTQAFATGAGGQSVTIGLASIPLMQHAGNAFLITLGQSTSANGSSANYIVTVNGYPAQPIMNGQSATNAFQYAIFYVDDIALRNNMTNLNGTVGQSGYRPFNSETYTITLQGGFDPTKPVYYGNTYGLQGHAGLQCLTLCGANLYDSYFGLPSSSHDHVQFMVQTTSGVPLVGARVLRTNDSVAQTTDANGNTWFNDTFSNSHYTITQQGYATGVCADFYFRGSPGVSTGVADDACTFIRAWNATFTVPLASLASLNGGSNGSATTGSTPALVVTFNATSPIFTDGQLVIVQENRTTNQEVWTSLYQLDQAGNPELARGSVPYDWTSSQPNTLTFTWPDGRTLTSADTGQYLLAAFVASSASQSGTLVAADNIGIDQGVAPVGTSVLTNLNVAGQSDISTQQQTLQATSVANSVVTEATVQSHFLAMLDWWTRSDFLVPNMVFYPGIFLLLALMLRFGVARTNGGRR